MTLLDWVNIRVEASGRTQRDIAAACGIAPPNLSAILDGRRPLRPQHLEALCRNLRVTVDLGRTLIGEDQR